MKTTSWTTDSENELADEAMRLIPGIALANLQKSDGTLVLYQAYLDEAKRLRVPAAKAWQIFSVTSIRYAMRVLVLEAEFNDVDVETIAQQSAIAVDEWSRSDA